MQIRPLIWEYIGTEHCLWRGTADGLLSQVSFFVTLSSKAKDEYLVRCDLNGIANEICIGLEAAKIKAQDLLNSYAISLILP
ncbi:MAG: hypothetical protein JST26_05760 [Bacteroidetes bacterium]|nr:hypothetical protein [Bacteroidota bacterium]